MIDIINFLEVAFREEVTYEYAFRQPDKKALDEIVRSFNDRHCTLNFKNVIVKNRLSFNPDEYYEEGKDLPMSEPRKLLKLSHYTGSEYGDVYLAYTTMVNPLDDYDLEFMDCFFIIKEGDQWKFAKNYYFGDPMNYKDHWIEGPGENELTFETIGDFVETQRFIEPVDDDSKEDYWLDK
ncbi:hypothetical protein [Aureivirga sp. CE67]|uniref:hypothetical protein n=1 Tax=Aureivirga sp. CE67 TaxID=1788983 RepID=UPI0018CBDAE3|nr:hypothetical protein [Aureivirga sp. CE67]